MRVTIKRPFDRFRAGQEHGFPDGQARLLVRMGFAEPRACDAPPAATGRPEAAGGIAAAADDASATEVVEAPPEQRREAEERKAAEAGRPSDAPPVRPTGSKPAANRYGGNRGHGGGRR